MPVNWDTGNGLANQPPGSIGLGGFSLRAAAGTGPAEEKQMRSTMTAIGAALVSAAVAAAPASAQDYGAQPQQQQQPIEVPQNQPEPQQDSQEAQPTETTGPEPKVSRKAVNAIKDLQAAVVANNFAEVPAKVAAANAVAQTPDDRYMIGVLRYQAAVNAKDDAARVAAIEAMLASGFAATPRGDLYADLGATYNRLKQSDRATAAFQQALQLNPNNVSANAGLAEALVASGKAAEGLALLQKGIALQTAGGSPASESWYQRALQIAYKEKLPQAVQISRDWIKAYPTTKNWGDALAIYQNLGQLDETQMLDLLRLKRTVGALTPADYFNYSDIAARKGLSGEAKAVLEEGFAANAINRSDPSFRQLYSLATERSKGDREGLPAAPVASANARQTLVIGDAYYGYGDFAKALEFYRAALEKEGADPNVINLRIGMALVRQGDKAGATAALNSVGGAQADIAKYWLLYTSTQA